MSYVDKLSATQKKNIGYLLDAMQKGGITSPISQASILAVISKESEFIPQSENLNYSADSIVRVFGLSRSEAEKLARNPEALANRVYANKYGNNKPGDGWKYRGRGFNQLTFKGNYENYGKTIGKDLVSSPDSVNNPKTAGEVAVAFFKSGISSLKSKGKLNSYNSDDINGFKNTKDGVLAFYHVNAGTGKDVSYIKGLLQNDSLGGMTKAQSRVNDILAYIKTQRPSAEGVKIIPTLMFALLIVGGYIVYKKYRA